MAFLLQDFAWEPHFAPVTYMDNWTPREPSAMGFVKHCSMRNIHTVYTFAVVLARTTYHTPLSGWTKPVMNQSVSVLNATKVCLCGSTVAAVWPKWQVTVIPEIFNLQYQIVLLDGIYGVWIIVNLIPTYYLWFKLKCIAMFIVYTECASLRHLWECSRKTLPKIFLLHQS